MRMQIHTCLHTVRSDSEHTINFAFNNLWRGDGSHSLSIFIAKEGRMGWAQYFSSNTARCVESKGTKQASLPTANTRAVLSGAYITHTGETMRHTVSWSYFHWRFHHFSWPVHACIIIYWWLHLYLQKGLGYSGSGAALSVHSVSFLPTFSLSPPSLCLSISFSLLKLSFDARSGSRNCW